MKTKPYTVGEVKTKVLDLRATMFGVIPNPPTDWKLVEGRMTQFVFSRFGGKHFLQIQNESAPPELLAMFDELVRLADEISET